MKPGTYYVGDLCYVVQGEKWKEVCKMIDEDEKGSVFQLDGHKFFIHGTYYGDGTYLANNNGDIPTPLPVDSGTIGCCPIELINIDLEEAKCMGMVVEFTRSFETSYHNGRFQIGNFTIDTTDEGCSCEEDED